MPSGDRLAKQSMRWGRPDQRAWTHWTGPPRASSSFRFPLCSRICPRGFLVGHCGLAQSISADVLEGEGLRGCLGRRRLWPQSRRWRHIWLLRLGYLPYALGQI